MSFVLKDNAIFIADSHYNINNPEFKEILNKLEQNEIEFSQIFFLGDNFDFISGESKYFIKQNKELINIINSLSLKYEIFYLEGNHDYNLQKLFPKVKVFKREEQALVLKYKDKTIAISHGDNFTSWDYNLYCKIIRNSYLLYFLNFIDINNFISKRIEKALLKKNICHKMDDFESLARKRVKNYKEDIIIEGHFHQGKSFVIGNQEYINIPSLYCQKDFTRFKDGRFIIESLKD
ncbi:UDP-2,3-diacylglucosamine hydrolase [Aliarcobacter thereius]|uniref:UDP-2,3-diacylglucosamine diphosphatase n=2 Tax=Aliarcobacter thereius TaxID=544718 RepID=A0A1C0B6H4_9BACT|nr:metallophosphoesterase [Aliarcobacter thereius]OCL86733.1 UDP-2,3-diacylglucosamine hydrolase [Aliarcobacter thereius]OCL90935.1 UDP-2,3-diacylglucosamine hydrolase [Aliarcobacter thereius]OCL96236.1 UDP-2,3-diacylglucosamine hydrolase [Aliarcobacter thereius LMG 24486]OCL98902.1 UDP-2,3-diacylglucosamine hydrolase [Aliarcobacter thereius]QBF15799.1 UDP-2,3-diacylglucosamine hydrolase [Aliarcobacter thereius LMG 24486]